MLDLDNIDRFSAFVDAHFFYPFYERVQQAAQETPLIALAAPLVGVADGLAGLVQAIGGVAEAALKGTANLLKGTFTRRSDCLYRGALQWGLGAGLVGLASLPILAFRTLRIAVGMARSPRETSATQFENYRRKLSIQPLVEEVPDFAPHSILGQEVLERGELAREG